MGTLSDTIHPVSSESWLHERYDRHEFPALVRLVAEEKRTGQIVVHISQGAIHSIEWKQRAPRAERG